jgi:hypothetical protein
MSNTYEKYRVSNDEHSSYTFDEIIDNIDSFYIPYEWVIYMDLVDTKCCPEDYYFYNWDIINDHPRFQEIINCKNDFIDNYDNIINIVKDILYDMYNKKDFVKVGNYKFKINYWVFEELIICDYCDRVWDGMAQCQCNLAD